MLKMNHITKYSFRNWFDSVRLRKKNTNKDYNSDPKPVEQIMSPNLSENLGIRETAM